MDLVYSDASNTTWRAACLSQRRRPKLLLPTRLEKIVFLRFIPRETVTNLLFASAVQPGVQQKTNRNSP